MTYFLRSVLLLAVGVTATGCITTAEQQAQRNEERCVARGYQPKTDGFKDCLLRVEGEHDQRMQARHQEQVEKSGIPQSNTRGY